MRVAMFDIDHALRTLVERGGSDLHLKVAAPPMTRIDGLLSPIEGQEPLTAAETQGAVHHMLDDPVKLEELATEHEVDFS